MDLRGGCGASTFDPCTRRADADVMLTNPTHVLQPLHTQGGLGHRLPPLEYVPSTPVHAGQTGASILEQAFLSFNPCTRRADGALSTQEFARAFNPCTRRADNQGSRVDALSRFNPCTRRADRKVPGSHSKLSLQPLHTQGGRGRAGMNHQSSTSTPPHTGRTSPEHRVAVCQPSTPATQGVADRSQVGTSVHEHLHPLHTQGGKPDVSQDPAARLQPLHTQGVQL